MKKVLTVMMVGVMLCMSVLSVSAAEKVTPSKKYYTVDLYKAHELFLCNKEKVDVTNGEAVYMTYTVAEIESDSIKQQGFIATTHKDSVYPYDKCGIMDFDHKSVLFKEGYTYFLKFQVTEVGFEYAVAYSNGEDEKYIVFDRTVGEIKDNMAYCGIWAAVGGVTGKLTHVRCYDKDGKDLGVSSNAGGATVYEESKMQPKDMVHTYEFSLKDASHVAISNKKATKSKVVYMEYTIKDATSNFSQTGLEMTNSPTNANPLTLGAYIKFNYLKKGDTNPLAISGAKYLIRFERVGDGFDALVQYTLDGRTRYTTFTLEGGKKNPDYRYFTLWFGEGTSCKMTAKFVDFKCYDEAGNNLGIQTNQGVKITHYGGLEDYTPCEASYYCKENDTLITLTKDQKVNKLLWKAGTAENGTYVVDELELTMKMNGKQTKYDYGYIYLTDEAGNQYDRLKEYQVKFVTGADSKTETASMVNQYRISKPQDPTLKDNTFKGWCLGDGTEYTFDSIVTNSITLYAKWMDGDGNEYLATETIVPIPQNDTTPAIVITTCALTIIATVVGTVFIVKRGNKNEKKQAAE